MTAVLLGLVAAMMVASSALYSPLVPASFSSPGHELSLSATGSPSVVRTTSNVPHLDIPNLPIGHSPGENPAAWGVTHTAIFLGISPSFAGRQLPAPVLVQPPTTRTSGPLAYSNGTLGWNGLNNNAPNDCGCTPPDTMGGAGAGYVVEMVNTAIQVWSSSGTNLSAENLQVLFGTTDGLSDPVVHYDPMSGRWFAEIISVSNYGESYLAVSTTSNPAGTWYQYLTYLPNHTGTSGDLPDQINIGVSAHLITLSGNDFQGGATAAGAVFIIVNKDTAVNGTAPAFMAIGPWGAYASVHAGENMAFNNAVDFISSSYASTTTLNFVSITGTYASHTWAFANFTTSSNAPGSPTTPDSGSVVTNDNRVTSAAWRGGDLWGVANEGTCASGAVSCLHLWEINTTTSSLSQDFTWSPSAALSAFYGGLTMDASNNLGVVYSFAGSTAYPSVGITGQATTDSANTLETPTVAKAGVADGSSGTRFGDYSQAGTDMSTGKMWAFGEWDGTAGCTGGGCYEWDTWVQSFSFGGSVVTGPSISSYTASPSPIALGGTTFLNVTATGGVGPLTYAYSGLPAGCASTNVTSLACTSTATGTFTVMAIVHDSAASPHFTYGNATFTVTGIGPTISSFTASPTSYPQGGSTSLTVVASGGIGPLSYAYSGLPSPCVGTNASSISCSTTLVGTYPVTVTVSDSASTPHTATQTTSFTVTTNAPIISSFTISPSVIVAGGTVTLTAVVSGGVGTLLYSYAGLPSSCPSQDLTSFTCTTSTAGTYTVTLNVSDSATPTNYATPLPATFTVTSSGSGPTISLFTISPASISLGGTTYLNVTASGGVGPLSYVYTGLTPSGCASSNASKITCTPTSTGGPFTVTVTVSDSATPHNSAASQATFSVVPGPLSIISFTANPASITQGQSSTLTVTTSGGTGTLSYHYSNLPSPCTTHSAATLTCTPTNAGTSTIMVNVSDTAGAWKESNVTLTVTAEVPPTAVLAASSTSVVADGNIWFNTTVTGGTSPYSYVYNGLPTGCTTNSVAQLACVPTQTGTYSVKVTVTDNLGQSVASNAVSVTVTSPPSANSGPSGLVYDLLILAIIAAAVAIVAVVVWRSRKRKSTAAPPPGPYMQSPAPQWAPPPQAPPSGQWPPPSGSAPPPAQWPPPPGR